MASRGGASGVDNTSRKTWDKAEYADKAKERQKQSADDSEMDARKRKRMERDPLHQGLIVQRASLKARDYQIDLASNLNKSTVHSVTGPVSGQAGFYCDVCDCVLKDSMAYLDHINGKWHNRALGMSMNVEKSTVDQVRKRLEEAKRRKKEGVGGGGSAGGSGAEDHVPDGMNKEKLKKEEEEASSSDSESDEEDSDEDEAGGSGEEAEEEEDNGVDPDLAAMMGFGGFGGSKKS